MEFRELSDEQWQFIQPLLPQGVRTAAQGHDRRTLNGILVEQVRGGIRIPFFRLWGAEAIRGRRVAVVDDATLPGFTA